MYFILFYCFQKFFFYLFTNLESLAAMTKNTHKNLFVSKKIYKMQINLMFSVADYNFLFFIHNILRICIWNIFFMWIQKKYFLRRVKINVVSYGILMLEEESLKFEWMTKKEKNEKLFKFIWIAKMKWMPKWEMETMIHIENANQMKKKHTNSHCPI